MTSYLLLLLPSLAFAGNEWHFLPDGNMRFHGAIIANACRVEVEDSQMTVNLGRISSNRFHAVGEDVNSVSFAIHLRECSAEVSQRVGIAFFGNADKQDSNILSINETPESATGVGIALFNHKGSQLQLNPLTSDRSRILSGTDTLQFVAKYRATNSHITGGTANAQAWFSLTYQ